VAQQFQECNGGSTRSSYKYNHEHYPTVAESRTSLFGCVQVDWHGLQPYPLLPSVPTKDKPTEFPMMGHGTQ